MAEKRLYKGAGGFYYATPDKEEAKLLKGAEDAFSMDYNPAEDFLEAKEMSRMEFKKGGNVDIHIKHPGALHREMGIDKSKKIPMDKLKDEKRKAHDDDDAKLMKQVNFAMNARKFKK